MKNLLFPKVVDFRLAGLVVLLLLGACKKNKTQPDPDPSTSGSNLKQTPTTNRTELTNDSLFLYAKQVYLWNDALPSYDDFNPRTYGSGYAKELFAISQFKINPATNQPYEYRTANPSIPKYSYIEDITTRNPVAAVPNAQASVNLEGDGNDIGIFSVSAVGVSTTAYRLYILAVDKGSPADANGLTRGAYITSINGISVGTIANFDTEKLTINAAIYGDPASISIVAVRTNGTTFSGTLLKQSYKSNPIYKTNVLSVSGKKIGYLAYARFSNETNSFAALESAFRDFSTQGVTDLIIDLRYNGGGYVNTAEHLVNLIAPLTATGTMYKEYFNPLMQSNKATIMKNQPLLDANDKVRYASGGRMMNYYEDVDYSPANNTHLFSKFGNLSSVTNIVFIVSNNTASASELVINSLKPKMNVKLVGKQTYGKPVGFFPVRLENKYDVFYSMFETKNALDAGGYFSGMTPDVVVDKDYGDYDFGNPTEDLLKAAIASLTTPSGAVSVVSRNQVMSVSADNWSSTEKTTIGKFDQNKEFIGMIENRLSPKK